MRRLFAEGFAAFALVFAGKSAITINDVGHGAVSHAGIAITFGLVEMAMINAFGDISSWGSFCCGRF